MQKIARLLLEVVSSALYRIRSVRVFFSNFRARKARMYLRSHRLGKADKIDLFRHLERIDVNFCRFTLRFITEDTTHHLCCVTAYRIL